MLVRFAKLFGKRLEIRKSRAYIVLETLLDECFSICVHELADVAGQQIFEKAYAWFLIAMQL